MVTPAKKPFSTSPLTNPITSTVEQVAAEQRKAEAETAHRLTLDVLGLVDDPLKAAIEKVIPERVDLRGNRIKNGA